MKVKTQEPEGFDSFWQIWRPHMRHTDGRGDARERYRKELLKGAEPEDIIDGAKAYIRHLLSLPKDKQEFIPLAATWLHKQSFLDWCEHERTYQAHMAEIAARKAAERPQPIPEPTEDRAAIARRVYERLNMPVPEGLH